MGRNALYPRRVSCIVDALLLQIRRSINMRGLQMIGWYHSHPCSTPHPSLADIECQMEYQIQMKGEGNSYQPCLAMVSCPYTLARPTKESSLKAFWVMPPNEVGVRALRVIMPGLLNAHPTHPMYWL